VCCLEQDFPIVFHTPIIAREVLLCGACLVGSTEVIRKLPDYARVPDGYGCVAIEDVQDIEALSARLAAIARDPEPIASVTARGRAFARKAQADARDPDRLERLLKSAARGRLPSKRGRSAAGATTEAENPRFPITQLAARALEERSGIRGTSAAPAPPSGSIDLPKARDVLAAAERGIKSGDLSLRPVASAIRLEIAVAEAESAAGAGHGIDDIDPLFRLRTKRWAMANGDLAELVPVPDPQLRILTIDVSELVDSQTEPAQPAARRPRPRRVVAFAQMNGERREPLFISDATARILELSDGKRTAREIAAEIASESQYGDGGGLQQIEELFVSGLLRLHDGRIDRVESARPDTFTFAGGAAIPVRSQSGQSSMGVG
jgi:hypothetical protein